MPFFSFFFFFNDPAPTEIYTLSLPAALPIPRSRSDIGCATPRPPAARFPRVSPAFGMRARRSEEHTSELQSHSDLVCRLLLEKKKKTRRITCSSDRKIAGSAHVELWIA